MNCIHPIPVSITKLNGRIVKLLTPCGKCEACLVKKKQAWVFRLSEHHKHSSIAYFVILTYSDSNLPRLRACIRKYGTQMVRVYSDCPGAVYGVDKSDVQKFLKRLCKALNALPE